MTLDKQYKLTVSLAHSTRTCSEKKRGVRVPKQKLLQLFSFLFGRVKSTHIQKHIETPMSNKKCWNRLFQVPGWPMQLLITWQFSTSSHLWNMHFYIFLPSFTSATRSSIQATSLTLLEALAILSVSQSKHPIWATRFASRGPCLFQFIVLCVIFLNMQVLAGLSGQGRTLTTGCCAGPYTER